MRYSGLFSISIMHYKPNPPTLNAAADCMSHTLSTARLEYEIQILNLYEFQTVHPVALGA